MKRMKKAKKTTNNKPNTELLVLAVCQAFRADPTAPSVVLSHTGSKYYASICRYREKFSGSKYVVCSASENSFEEVVAALSRRWLELSQAKTKLASVIGEFEWSVYP